MNNFKKVKKYNLVKIVGRNFLPFKEKPYYLVLEKKEYDSMYNFLLFSCEGKKLWIKFEKKNPFGGIDILS